MSERGSFVTQYIHCNRCLQAAKKVLLGQHKYLCSVVIPTWVGSDELPIVAGKVGGLYSGEEFFTFGIEYKGQLETELCHDLRVAVLCDDPMFDGILTIKPVKPKEKSA